MKRRAIVWLLVIGAVGGLTGCDWMGDDDGPGACVMHKDDGNTIHKCIAVISRKHCDSEGEIRVGSDEFYTYRSGKTCAQLGYKYCEFNGCIIGGEEAGCKEGNGTHMYGTSTCDNDYPPPEIDCTDGAFEGVYHSLNPNGTVKAHWDFDQCRVVSWDNTGTICGFHVTIDGFQFTGVSKNSGQVTVSYGDYYNWTLCDPGAHWQLDPTAPKGEQSPIPWSLNGDGTLNVNGETLIPGNGTTDPPGWDGVNAPDGDACESLPAGSCGGF